MIEIVKQQLDVGLVSEFSQRKSTYLKFPLHAGSGKVNDVRATSRDLPCQAI